MRQKTVCVLCGMIFTFIAALLVRADEVEMLNGDRYFGKVLSVSADSVSLESEVLGRINVPRKAVAHVTIGARGFASKASTAPAQRPESTNSPGSAATTTPVTGNADLSTAFRNLGANTNFIPQVRERMLLGNPEAEAKYDEWVNGLLTGKLDMNDLRREAESSADQLRAIKQDLGPDAGDSLDAYLEVLDRFLKETADQPTNSIPAARRR